MASENWHLRLFHEGFASIRVERQRRWLRFDSITRDPTGIHLPTGAPDAPIHGLVQTIQSDDRPTVAAPPLDLQALEHHGTIDGHMLPAEFSGVSIDFMESTPAPKETVLPSPRQIARRLRSDRSWRPIPRVIELSFQEGGRLVHLGCGLHADTPQDWLEEAVRRFKGADWLILGIHHGHADAVLAHTHRFEAKEVLVSDLVNDARKQIGLPTEWLTPTVDRLQDQGIAAHPFPPQSSMRFETLD